MPGGSQELGLRSPAASELSVSESVAAVERQEHQANVLRLRRGARLGFGMWIAFATMDVWSDAYIQAGTLRDLLLIRACAVVLPSIALARLYVGPPPTPLMLSLASLMIFGVSSYAVATMTLVIGGIDSPYFVGTLVVMVAQAAFFAQPWRRAIVQVIATASAYPVMAIVGIFLSGENARDWADPAIRATYVLYCSNIVLLAAFACFASHLAWSMRRRIFESRSVGRYRLERLIGAGGMGEVWAAYHHGLKRQVAVKLLKLGDQSARSILRFEREVAATSQLSHPNTIRVFDFGVTEDSICYYAMELLVGCDLADLVAQEGPLVPARAVHLVVQAARALAEAHRKGIHHRDLKPENLFVTSDGLQSDFVKLLDFGIAKQLGSDETVTAAGAIIGTPAYISPEGARGRPTDARSDVYSLGAVFYFALSGHPPFDAATVELLLIKHMTEPAPILPDRVPPEVQSIVFRCLEKDPSQRFADAQELLAALTRCESANGWQPQSGEISSTGMAVQSPAAQAKTATLRS